MNKTKKMANNSMNSDWKKLRRFAMQLFPAGYAERSIRMEGIEK